MIYLLDTNVCIKFLNGRSPSISQRLASTSPTDIVVCSIVKAELCCGAMQSNNPTQTLRRQQIFLEQFVSLPFDDQVTLFYAQIRTYLEDMGTPIGAFDLQIAAIALAHDLILVTHNTREFSRVNDLKLEDWQMEA